MGAVVAPGLSAACVSAPAEEIKAAYDGLPDDAKKKVLAALGGAPAAAPAAVPAAAPESAPAAAAAAPSDAAIPTVDIGATKMPLVGYGTYKVGAVPASASSAVDGAPPPPSGPEVCEKIIADAMACGYNMFDCAQFYMNEAWVGGAIKKSGVSRDKLYITSKVWNDVIYGGEDAVKAQVDKTIADLQCEYIDLYLVHWPVPGKHVEAYNALRQCKKAGKIKAIGVSNYCIEDMEELKDAGEYGENDSDKPALNQIEVNPLLYRKKTLDYFKKEGIHVQAYRGLMQGPKAWENPVLQEVCKESGKTPPQVLGRFLVQQGISHVPKASSLDRMTQNKDVFSFELSDAQMEKLSSLTTDAALENFEELYLKCIWRDTPEAGSGFANSQRTLD
jgi:diketogulonate reductase-like aldo/keto reductase